MKRKNFVDIVSFIMSSSFVVFFVLSLLLMTVVGVKYYNRINRQTDENYQIRTSLLYLTNKIRQNNISHGVLIREWDNGKMLVLPETIGDTQYETRIYRYDDALYEIFCKADSALSPSSGQRITQVSMFDIEINEDNLLVVRVSESEHIYISLWCEV